jgi:hypothetical protein
MHKQSENLYRDRKKIKNQTGKPCLKIKMIWIKQLDFTSQGTRKRRINKAQSYHKKGNKWNMV